MNTNRGNAKTTMMVIIFAAVIAAVAYLGMNNDAGEDGAAGTIMNIQPAERHRGEQLNGDDVVMGEESIAQFMQTDTFQWFLDNPEAQKFLSSPEVMKFMSNPEAQKFMSNPEAQKFMSSPEAQKLIQTEALKRLQVDGGPACLGCDDTGTKPTREKKK